MTEKRRKRIIDMYMGLKAIESNITMSFTKAQMIVESIAENVSTTQLNQINISLANKLEEYYRGEQK